MKAWLVLEPDFDGYISIKACYSTHALAKEHAETYGLSELDIEEVDVLDSLTPDAADPVLRAKRAEEREAAKRFDAERLAAFTRRHQRP